MRLGKRILILGCSGAGKSTLARRLGERLGLPVVFVDQLIFQPGWVMEERERLTGKMKGALRRKAWVLDGSLRRHTDLAVAASDTVIFLDFSRWLCLFRVLARVATKHGQVRHEMAEGCPEHLDLEFLTWIWNWPRDRRPGILNEMAGAKRALVFRRPRDLERWLQSLP
jgi:adenylate kinase family enzyme